MYNLDQSSTAMAGPSRIAFGSCNEQGLQNKLWSIIESRSPAAFVWGGDAIYADIDLPLDWSEFPPKSSIECATPDRLRRLYSYQRSVPEYRHLLQTNVTIFGTFDDHDYGCNNADRTFPYKQESANAFIQFTNEPKHSPVSKRVRAGHGVYGVKLFDFSRAFNQYLVPDEEAGIDPDISSSINSYSLSNMTVAVFVLDCRSNKTPWKKGSAAYQPDYDGDFLGERQWNWFETAIRRSRASVNVVVNGLQVHSNIFPDANVAEAWGKYPRAQQRLFDALLQDGVQAPILVSGDVHMSQFMRKDCAKHNGHSVAMRPLIELTTSGMTHSWGSLSSPPMEDLAYEASWKERYFSFVAGSVMRLLHFVGPWTEMMKSGPRIRTESFDGLFESGGAEGAKTGKQFSLEKNFGELEFDWTERTVIMRSIGEGPDSIPLLSAKWSMDQLSGRASMPGGLLTSKDFLHERRRETGLEREWICLNHRGTVNHFQHMLGHVAAGITFTSLVAFPFLIPAYAMFVLLFRYRSIGKDRKALSTPKIHV